MECNRAFHKIVRQYHDRLCAGLSFTALHRSQAACPGFVCWPGLDLLIPVHPLSGFNYLDLHVVD